MLMGSNRAMRECKDVRPYCWGVRFPPFISNAGLLGLDLNFYNRSDTVFINGGRAERPGFECLKARLGRPCTDHKTKQKIWRLLVELAMKVRV